MWTGVSSRSPGRESKKNVRVPVRIVLGTARVLVCLDQVQQQSVKQCIRYIILVLHCCRSCGGIFGRRASAPSRLLWSTLMLLLLQWICQEELKTRMGHILQVEVTYPLSLKGIIRSVSDWIATKPSTNSGRATRRANVCVHIVVQSMEYTVYKAVYFRPAEPKTPIS